MSNDFQLPWIFDLVGPNHDYAIVAVLLASGVIWAVSAHNSTAHKLSLSVFVSAAAAVLITAALRVAAMGL